MLLLKRQMRILVTFAVLVAALSFLLSLEVYGQVTGATLTGTISDPTGAVIPGAQVAIRNTATGVLTRVQANIDGLYTAPNLIAGTYEARVTADGFETQLLRALILTVGAQQVFNVKMVVGQMTQTVEVTDQAMDVQLADSSISGVVNSTTVVELPLNGRSWSDLAKLQPGVTAIRTQAAFSAGPDRGNRGFGAQISISGQRPAENSYRLDGVNINDYSNGAPGSVLGGTLGVDAIQEFSVLTSNYSAEYGRTAGGVVNAITKSGTNQFHGSVYEFLRNSALDARNFFDAGGVPPFRRNQFGASAGGPIRKDNTFIFADYEGIRQAKGISTVDTVLSPAARQGNLTTGTVTVDQSVRKYLGFWPLPNGPVSGDTGLFTFAPNQVIAENFFTFRFDDTLSSKDNLFATYLYDDTPYNSPDGLNAVLIQDQTKRQVVVLEETHKFGSSLVNSARVGYSRDGVTNNTSVSAINSLAADPSLGAVPGQNAADVSVGGLTEFTGGLGGNSNHFYWNSFQGYDDAFYYRGTHSIKFGGVVERMQLNEALVNNPIGLFTFASIQDFLTNLPSRFNVGLSATPSARRLRETLVGLYVQDDWRVRPSLTVNLGLRWEMTTVPTETQGRLVSLLNISDAQPHIGSPLFRNPTLHNFDPRVGFAWDPFHKGTTAVRGGFGFFDVVPLLNDFMFLESEPAPFTLTSTVNNLPQGSFYTGALSQVTPDSTRSAFIQQNTKRTYVMQWNLNVQHQLAPSLTAMAGFVGSRGVHHPFRADDIDMVLPRQSSAGYLFPSPIGSGTKVNPNFGSIRGLFWGGDSFYNAFEARITKRISRGFQVQGSFTWSKSIDTSDSNVVGDQFATTLSSLPFYDLHALRGLADFNVGRTLVDNAVWDVPAPKTLNRGLDWFLGGWEVGGIFTASDGTPFTATWGRGGDPQGLNSSDPYAFPDRLTGPRCRSLVNPGNPGNYIKKECFTIPTAPSAAFYAANCDPNVGVFPQCFNLRGNAGRNILTAPGLTNLDLSLYKNMSLKRVSENFKVQFRVELYNVLNRADFAPPPSDIFLASGAPNPTAGVITSTADDSRQIQFALKFTW
jgi:hypothetical protein